jgi:hypothetical protein
MSGKPGIAQGDLSTAATSLHNGEWKAATVLAGAASEALLLWALAQDEAASLLAARTAAKPEKRPMLEWGLETMIGVAEDRKLIGEATAKQGRLGKDFRNLIHPGRAVRTRQICDKATAYGAIAAAEAIARDLKAKFA